MTLNPNGIGIPGGEGLRPGFPGGVAPSSMATFGGVQPQPGMGIMAMMAAAAPPPQLGIWFSLFCY